MRNITTYVQHYREQKWAVSTRLSKDAALRNFYDFLQGAGIADDILQSCDLSAEKSRAQMLREEDVLCSYAMMRIMAGQSPAGALQYVSHIRTAYKHIWRAPFGLVGDIAGMSYTSEVVKSLRHVSEFMTKSDDQKRFPINQDSLALLVQRAISTNQLPMAAVMATAWGGLFRMGELTAAATPFNPALHITEADLTFQPTFWTATHVVIREGPSKADQTGVRRRQNPRVLPVNSSFISAGRLLRWMLVQRYQLDRRLVPSPTFNARTPLFIWGDTQCRVSERQVLDFTRRQLRRAGFPSDDYGTHSFRIGGFNRLFHMGIPIETIKRIGGWSSEAWRDYVRLQQSDCLRVTAWMVSHE
jgi:hypothetical protein